MSHCCGCCLCVNESEVAVVEHCGRFDSLAAPGISCLCSCCGYTVAGTVSKRLCPLDIKCETKTRDNVFVELAINAQYRVITEHEYDAFYSLDDREGQIRSWIYDVVRSAVPRLNLDQVFEQKEEIATEVKNTLALCMADYGWEIIQVLIADIEPDAKVKAAMNEINTAQRLRVATVDKADADYTLTVKRAEADAEAKYLAGVGIARQRKAIADGVRDSVLAFTSSDPGTDTHDIMDLVLVTQYFDTLKELSEKSWTTTVFLPGKEGGQSAEDQSRNGILQAEASKTGQDVVRARKANHEKFIREHPDANPSSFPEFVPRK